MAARSMKLLYNCRNVTCHTVETLFVMWLHGLLTCHGECGLGIIWSYLCASFYRHAVRVSTSWSSLMIADHRATQRCSVSGLADGRGVCVRGNVSRGQSHAASDFPAAESRGCLNQTLTSRKTRIRNPATMISPSLCPTLSLLLKKIFCPLPIT